MALVLRGVVVEENRGFFRKLVSGKPEAVRVFRDEDVEYLAPLLVEGLTRAASDQQVGFRVVRTGVPAESTKGSLYHPLSSLSRSRQIGLTVIATRAQLTPRW